MLEDNFKENFKKWTPDKRVDEVYDMEFAGYVKDEGFVVILIPDHFEKDKRSNHKVKLIWDNIITYLVTEEGYRPELWISDEEYLWSFYTSQTSNFLTKFRKENYLVPENTYHFLLAGTNLVVDVLSSEFPRVSFVS